MPNNLTQLKRKSLRLPEYDYTSPGAYFITICTDKRRCVFGNIRDGKMHVNPLGQIVAEEWVRINQFFEHATPDQYVVMPNHVHGIIILQPSTKQEQAALGQIIRAFKSQATKRIRQTGFKQFSWQRGYYEHVIRNETSLRETREYIINNPAQWAEDRNNPYRIENST